MRVSTEKGEMRRRAYVASVQAAMAAGDLSALTTMAQIYEGGFVDERGRRIIRRDRARALKLYRKAAKRGDPAAMLNLAAILWMRGERRRAMLLERAAAKAGYAAGAHNLGASYRSIGRLRTAVRWFREAVRLGDHSSLLEVAKAELLGAGTKRVPGAALRKLRVVCLSASVCTSDAEEAAILAARTLLDGWLVSPSIRRAVSYLKLVSHYPDCASAKSMLRDLTPESE